jgi:predicted nucleotidyltransferase
MKIASKHEERDQNLQKERDVLLDRMITSLKDKPDVIGIFLGGSLANGNEDAYSDIDLRVVVEDDKLAYYIENKQKVPREWGNVLFYEDIYPKSQYTIAHYDSFVKVDLFFYTSSNLLPSIWLKGIKIIYDRKGFISKVLQESESMEYAVTQQQVLNWRGKVFAYIHEIYRRAMRGEYYYALTNLNSLRHFIVQGWDMEVSRQPNDGWDWSKIEGERSHLAPWQLSLLASWDCGRDQQEIMKTLASMVPELTRLHKKLTLKTGLEGEEQLMQQVIDQVL